MEDLAFRVVNEGDRDVGDDTTAQAIYNGIVGHESIQTTEDYLSVEQDLTDVPCNHLGLRLST